MLASSHGPPPTPHSTLSGKVLLKAGQTSQESSARPNTSWVEAAWPPLKFSEQQEGEREIFAHKARTSQIKSALPLDPRDTISPHARTKPRSDRNRDQQSVPAFWAFPPGWSNRHMCLHCPQTPKPLCLIWNSSQPGLP